MELHVFVMNALNGSEGKQTTHPPPHPLIHSGGSLNEECSRTITVHVFESAVEGTHVHVLHVIFTCV